MFAHRTRTPPLPESTTDLPKSVIDSPTPPETFSEALRTCQNPPESDPRAAEMRRDGFPEENFGPQIGFTAKKMPGTLANGENSEPETPRSGRVPDRKSVWGSQKWSKTAQDPLGSSVTHERRVPDAENRSQKEENSEKKVWPDLIQFNPDRIISETDDQNGSDRAEIERNGVKRRPDAWKNGSDPRGTPPGGRTRLRILRKMPKKPTKCKKAPKIQKKSIFWARELKKLKRIPRRSPFTAQVRSRGAAEPPLPTFNTPETRQKRPGEIQNQIRGRKCSKMAKKRNFLASRAKKWAEPGQKRAITD